MRLVAVMLLLAVAGCSAGAMPSGSAQPAPGTLRPYAGGLTTVGIGVGR